MSNEKQDFKELSDLSKSYLLDRAAHAGALDVAKALLEAGADPNYSRKDINAARPLQTAFKNGDLPMVNLLMEHGASTKANFHGSQIENCMKENSNYKELIKAVFEKEPDQFQVGHAINHCAKNGDAEFLDYLFTKDFSITTRMTAMTYACRLGHTNVVQKLHENEFVIRLDDIVNAACNGHFETTEKILKISMFDQDELNDAMISTYRRTNDYDKVNVFLQAGANPNTDNDDLFNRCSNDNNQTFIERLIVQHRYKPSETTMQGLQFANDDFSSHVKNLLKKLELNEKLNQKHQPRQVKTKSLTMKI